MERKIILYEDYFLDFLQKLSKEEVIKINKALALLIEVDKIPYHFIKYIRDGIYELRVSHRHSTFRIFFIYDEATMVVLFNGFRKKTQKTPNREIEKAIKLKNQYYNKKKSTLL